MFIWQHCWCMETLLRKKIVKTFIVAFQFKSHLFDTIVGEWKYCYEEKLRPQFQQYPLPFKSNLVVYGRKFVCGYFPACGTMGYAEFSLG